MWRTYPTLAALVLAGCAAPAANQGAHANPDGSVTVTIKAQRVAECAKNGGCALVTRDELNAFAEDILRSQSCRRQRGSSL